MATSLAKPRRAPSGGAPAAGNGVGGGAERTPQVQSLLRALSLINLLAEAGEGMALTDLAQRVKLSTSTAHRLLTTLERERYVHFDAERKLWSVGVQAFVAGSAFLRCRDLVAIARPHLRALMEASGETVNLAILDGDQALYVAQVECRQTMRAIATPGARVPLHGSSVGKALLAAMPDLELVRTIGRTGLPAATPRTLATLANLRADLDLVKQRGFAIDDEEQAIGLRCAAAVIRDEFGEPVGAVSVSGPTARVTDDRLPRLGALAKAAAEAITRQFGGKG